MVAECISLTLFELKPSYLSNRIQEWVKQNEHYKTLVAKIYETRLNSIDFRKKKKCSFKVKIVIICNMLMWNTDVFFRIRYLVDCSLKKIKLIKIPTQIIRKTLLNSMMLNHSNKNLNEK